MKKIFKSALLLILSAIFLTACAPRKSGGNDTNIEGDLDFAGEEINIICDENNSDDFLYFKVDSAEKEELSARKAELEKKYNCKITIQNVEDGVESFVSSKSASNSAGSVDIILSLSYYTKRWAKAGYLYDISEYDDIVDYTDSFAWGDKNDLETMAVDGKIYGVIPASWPDNMKSFFYVIVTNNRLMKEAGYGDVRVYREEGTWSRETFEDFIKNCSQADKGIYSLDTGLESFITTSVYAAGGSVYDSDTGKSGLHRQGALEGLTWGREMLNKYSDKIYLHDDYRDKFLAALASMATADSSALTHSISKNTDIGEFSVLPFPKGPCADEQTPTGYIHSYRHAVSIPKIAGNTEASATIVSEFFAPLSSIPNEEALAEYYRNNVFWSDEDVDILLSESQKAEYNYWQEGFHDIMTSLAKATERISPAAALQSSVSAADNVIEKTIKANKEGFALYFEQ